MLLTLAPHSNFGSVDALRLVLGHRQPLGILKSYLIRAFHAILLRSSQAAFE
ncbi:MAG: hypothetical protein RMX65_013140 [Nostoc sp. DedQUE01]